MHDISIILKEFRSGGPSINDPVALKRLLTNILRSHFSDDACLDTTLSLLNHVFSEEYENLDVSGLSAQEQFYALKIMQMREPVRDPRCLERRDRISSIGRDADFISDNAAEWPILKVINFAMQLSIPHTRRSAIVTSIRNEGVSILEWIAHHRALGFDEIFIYTNNNTDASGPLLHKLADNQIIRLIENEVGPTISPQIKAYEHSTQFLPELRQFQWAFFIDADEFFIPRTEPNLDMDDFFEALKTEFGNLPPAAIAFNWKWFGSENAYLKTEGPLLRRFVHSIHNAHVKSLVQINRVISMRLLHCPILFDDSASVDSQFDPIAARATQIPPVYGFGQINHYWNKSFQEFVIKKFRGRGAVGATGAQRDFSTFFEWGANGRRGNLDPPPERIVTRTQLAYEQLLNIPGVVQDLDAINASMTKTISEVDDRLDLRRIYDNFGRV